MTSRRRRARTQKAGESAPGVDGEILPAGSKPDPNGSMTGGVYAEIAAQITNYTDRPDLLLEVMEKHDPGFIKGMNDEAREFSARFRLSRFRFGRFQSYAGVIVSVAVALAILYIIYLMAVAGALTFWHLVGFGILYAVTQSGPSGWMQVIKQIVNLVKGVNGK